MKQSKAEKYAINKIWRRKNRDRVNELERIRRARDPERRRLSFLKWKLNNPEAYRESCKRFEQSSKGKRRSKIKSAARRAARLKAMPKWANPEKIKEIYKNCPAGWHVDHVIPLKGENVCGFHVEYNLQYLTAEENCRKSNKVK